jgi:TonB family protein
LEGDVPGIKEQKMLELKPSSKNGMKPDPELYRSRQRSRMLLAIVLLLAAVTVVLVKDHQFWFSTEDETSDEEATAATIPNSEPEPHSVEAAERDKHHSPTKNPEQAAVVVPPAMIETHRTPVFPLNVQVVAGNMARILPAAATNALQVEIPANSGQWKTWRGNESDGSSGSTINAAARVSMLTDAPANMQASAERSSPLLTKSMKVRGSVVLQAMVSADGTIEDLRVLSGPTALASAAREAVRQWHFKPYVENGHAVETQAKITVNFVIATS